MKNHWILKQLKDILLTMSQAHSNTYLITGAAGFIGSQFVQSCQQSGTTPLISVDDKSHFSTRPEHQQLDYGTIIDRADLWDWLESSSTEQVAQIDGILHLGAITDTQETNQDHLNTWNLDYSKRLWNYATTHQIPFVYASSAATYGDGALGYDDNEEKIPLLKPLNLYGQSKQDFDLWVLEQERRGLHPPAWSGFKFFNVYGFGELHKGFMASVVLHSFEQIQKSGQVTLFKSHREGIADGFQKRDFVYVDDVVRVLQFALEKPIPRGIYNLGTGQARAFLDLSRAVFKALNKKENILFVDTPLAIRDKYQYFTEARMQKLQDQGYSATFTSLEEGVSRYIKKLLSF